MPHSITTVGSEKNLTKDEHHAREMSLNAHVAWALLMWGSGESARKNGSPLLAFFGYYYSAFHSGVALIFSDPSFHLEDTADLKHSKVESWLASRLPADLLALHAKLRIYRNATSYLGVGEAHRKLRLVRGHELKFGEPPPGSSLPLLEAVGDASASSRALVRHNVNALGDACAKQRWRCPRVGDPRGDWLTEYLGEDAFRTVIPSGPEGLEVYRSALSLLEAE